MVLLYSSQVDCLGLFGHIVPSVSSADLANTFGQTVMLIKSEVRSNVVFIKR